MMQYEKYRPSGIEWLGEIPSKWELKRLKDIKANINNAFVDGPFGSNLKTEHFIDNGDVYVIDSGYITSGTFVFHRDFKTISLNHFYTVNRSECKEDDIIIAKIGANYGMSAILPKLDKRTLVSGNTLKLTVNRKKYFLKYIHFSFLYLKESGQIDILVKGSAQPALSMGLLNDLSFCIPNSLYEQVAIANYLDIKTSAIDSKIELLTAKTDKFKTLRRSLINETVCHGLNPNATLKDGGVEWIGKIPEHWKIKRVKDVFKYTTGSTPDTKNESYYDGDKTWICIGDISDNKYISESKMQISNQAVNDLGMVKTPKGSLLYSFKLSIGKMAFVEKDVYTNEAILSIFPNKNISLHYIYYMLPYFLEIAATENIYGAKMLNQKLIANAFLAMPNLTEQIAIATYLEDKTTQIDTILSNIGKQINKLTQLRKTLINDVVTGQLKVTE